MDVDSVFGADICWNKTEDGEYPFRAEYGENSYIIRVNDWPEDPTVYTLLGPDGWLADFDDWPECWTRGQ